MNIDGWSLNQKRDIILISLAFLLLATVTAVVSWQRATHEAYADSNTSRVFEYRISGF